MGEENKHLTYFKVENFKCFDSFEMEDIGQFNLILGDNNVGKTSALEALLVDGKNPNVFLKTLINLFGIKTNIYGGRLSDTFGHLDLLETILKFYLKGSSKEIKFITESRSSGTSSFTITAAANSIPQIATNLNLVFEGLPFIFSNQLYDSDLSEFYSKNIQFAKTKKTALIEDLGPIISDVDTIEISNLQSDLTPVIIIGTKDKDKVLPLSIFGDGVIKLFRILIEIIKTSDHRLMIDEIDSGIHYSHFKDYWRTILKSAANNNVQLFMTTHNFECLKYLKEVLEEDDMKQYQDKTRSYTLVKLPDGRIKAYKYTFDQFEFSINQNIEIR